MLPSYAPGEASAYLASRGVQFRRTGDELLIEECFFCGKKLKLYINDDTGAYKCHNASCQQGNYFTLRRDLGDPVREAEIPQPLTRPRLQVKAPKKHYKISDFAKFEANLHGNPRAMAYLASRGITAESAKAWHLGLKTEPQNTWKDWLQKQLDALGFTGTSIDWLMIPYITRQGDIADVKYRALPPAPKLFKRLGGGESILFGEHLLPEKRQKVDTLYLCEGEIDCVSLVQHGFSPALSTTTGAGSFNSRWYDLIVNSGAKRIVLIYDSDVDGQAGAEKLSKKFTEQDREVINVVLEDAKDANEYLLTHTAEELRVLIGNSRPIEIEHCLSAATVLDRLEEQIFLSGGAFNGLPSQFRALNELIDGGYGNGYLVTIIGGSGTGKTSFALQELINMGTQGQPVYMCCLEMQEEMMMRKVINHLYHIPMNDIRQSHIAEYRADIERRNLFFGKGIRHLNVLDKTFRQAAKRYDLRAICFDNIHYLVRDTKDQQAQIGLVTRTLKDLAVDLNIPILAIAQPGKFDRAERIINENDVKGSSSIEQDSDNMILMWRPTLRTDIKDFAKSLGQKQNMSPLTLIRVGKARYSPGGEMMLYFHGEVGKFRELAPDEMERLKAETDTSGPAKRKRDW